MNSLSAFDDDLRHALASRARGVPLPAEALRIPRGWVGEPHSPFGLLGRGLAFAAVVAAAVIVVAQASSFLNRTEVEGIGSVAARLGLPERQVLQTQDGYLAVRFNPSRTEAVDLLLVPADGDPQVLATGVLQPAAREAGVVSLGAFPVSCDAERGLAQPNAVFGYAQMAGASIDQITLNLSAQNTTSDGLFLFALDPGKTPTDVATLTARSSGRPDLAGASDIKPEAFGGNNACSGEKLQPIR